MIELMFVDIKRENQKHNDGDGCSDIWEDGFDLSMTKSGQKEHAGKQTSDQSSYMAVVACVV